MTTKIPAPGSYREPLRMGLDKLGVKPPREIKLAKTYTSQPIIGMDIRKDLIPLVTQALQSVQDKFECCAYYIAALADGNVVPLTYKESTPSQEYWAPGELFLRS